MGQVTLQIPQVGQPNSTEGPKIASDFTTLQTLVNGNLDTTNLIASYSQSAGVNAGSVVKGASIVPTSQSVTSTSFSLLSTPDQVSNVVLATNGLLLVWFRAWATAGSSNVGKAAIFLNSTELTGRAGPGDTTSEASFPAAGAYDLVASTTFGLSNGFANGVGGPPADVATGQAMNSLPTAIFAAAGTYNVSVQFKSSSGSVTVANRHLYVQAFSFS